MKNKIPILIKALFAMIIIGWSSSTFAQYSGGNGSVGTPYLISNISDLQYLSLNGEADFHWLAGVCFEQTADIDASSISGLGFPEGFSPIGEDPTIDPINNTPFAGSYNGMGHSITGLYINRPVQFSVGLFGFMDAGSIVKNLGVTSANVTGGSNVGVLGGMVYEAMNCFTTGSVHGVDYVGGLAGLVGLASGSYSTCSVTGSGNWVGGFAGSDGAGTVTDCFATGAVIGVGSVGGFYGVNYSNVANCYSIGSVTGTSDVGGFIGEGAGAVDRCFWNTVTSGQAVSPGGGTGKTTAQMKQVGTYLIDPIGTWDFTVGHSIWGFNGTDNGGYPYLRYQGFVPKNVWLGTTSTVWNLAGNWSENSVPLAVDRLFVPDNLTNDPTISTAVTVDGLKIEDGGVLTIASAGTLTVTSMIINNPAESGLIMESDASLIHSTAGVKGSVTRHIPGDASWHLLACPINQATMPEICDGNFAPLTGNFDATTGATYDFFSWLEPLAAGNIWINLKKNDWSVNTSDFGAPPRFSVCKGYLVKYGPTFVGNEDKTFAGTLGVGNQSAPVTSSGNLYNLIGNPYPSSIDWKAASGWSRGALEDNAGGKDFWIWNDGGAGNWGAYNSALLGDAGTNGVSRYIAPTQGFFVKAASSGTVIMGDAVRVHSTQTWLKSDENNIRIKVTSTANSYSDEVILGFNYSANAGTEKITSMISEAPSLYLPVSDKIYCIRFVTEMDANPAIPVNFKSGTDGNYSFTITGIGSFSNIYLQDLKTGAMQDLKAIPTYTFISTTFDEPGRFLLRFSALGVENANAGDNGISVYNKVLNITNPGTSVVSIYSLLGQKVAEFRTNGEVVFQSPIDLTTGYYIVNVTDGKKSVSKKVLVK